MSNSTTRPRPPTQAVVQHPAETRSCPRCGLSMRLAGIEPDPTPEHRADLLTYECSCGQLLVESTELD
jgi:hypothetical protein